MTDPGSSIDIHSNTGVQLQGRTLFFARLLWVVIAAIIADLFLFNLPLGRNTALQNASGPEISQSLSAYGISPERFVDIKVIRVTTFFAIHAFVGLLIFWRKSSERAALYISLVLFTFGTSSFAGLVPGLTTLQTSARLMVFTGATSIGLFFLLFPDGNFRPPWTRYIALFWILLLAWRILFPEFSRRFSSKMDDVVTAGFIGIFLLAQVIRYKHWSTPTQRQQTKWVILGAFAAVIGWLLITFGFNVPAQDVLVSEIKRILQLGVFLFIPFSIMLAMFRYRLWNIDPIVNRTLVYTALTALVVGLYILIVTYLSMLFRTETNFFISLLSTGIVAVLFQPFREFLQRAINRLMYGERDDPYTVLSRLGRRLETTLVPGAALNTIVTTVAEALKLPYVAITTGVEDERILASTGTQADDVLRLPLNYQGGIIGQLLLSPRAPNDPFSPSDQRLLNDLARQIGPALHAVQLASELQHSREQLVLAREEERRRLRRDLHDDLAPTLAGLALTASSISDVILKDPAKGSKLASDLEQSIRSTVGNVRQIAYDLRPPALDELGLVAAIRERAAQYSNSSLLITVEADDLPSSIPAAVEVAAYRIVQEAMMNVVDHADARICHILIKLTGSSLLLEVEDDGVGLKDGYTPGVGLRSMRERAAELSGECVIEAGLNGGTHVSVRIPC